MAEAAEKTLAADVGSAVAATTTSTAKLNDNTTRLGQCEVCAVHAARYSCPKCEVKTCCVACVQIHKHELNCDGIRDRTKFIPLRHMTNQDFMSDYYFLEECTRYTEDRKVDRIKRYTRFNTELPLHLHRLRIAALERGTRILLLLQNFTRHKENTTYLNWKKRRLYWRIEWIFVNATASTTETANDKKDTNESNGVRHVDARCDEELTLTALLHKYMHDERTYKELAYYQSAGIQSLKLLLRAERKPGRGKCYFELDASKTLRENLIKRTVIEFPTIFVSYEQSPAGFDIIDSDEELEEAKATAKGIKRDLTNAIKAEMETVAAPKAKKRRKRVKTNANANANLSLLFSNEIEEDKPEMNANTTTDAESSESDTESSTSSGNAANGDNENKNDVPQIYEDDDEIENFDNTNEIFTKA